MPIALGVGFFAAVVALAMLSGEAGGSAASGNDGDADPPGVWFSWADLTSSATARQHGLDNTPGADARTALRELVAQVLDPLAEHLAGADYEVQITSGFRAPMVNKLAGGQPSSDHQSGHAADIAVPGLSPAYVAWLCVHLELPFDQLILYATHLHVGHRSENRGQILRKTDAGFAPLNDAELEALV